MNFFYLFAAAILFSGCLYFNDTGISSHLYDNCKEYFDECGNYHKECPKNLIDYSDISFDSKNGRNDSKECSESEPYTR